MYVLTIIDVCYKQIDTYFDNDIANLNKIMSKELIKITDTDSNWNRLRNVNTNINFNEIEISNIDALENYPLYIEIYEGLAYYTSKPDYMMQIEKVI